MQPMMTTMEEKRQMANKTTLESTNAHNQSYVQYQ